MSDAHAIERMRTGIAGLDQALGGGLPRGRTTLVVGSPGAGKTVFALQALAQGARLGEAGVLLTFEESPKDLLANMAAFTWAPSGRARALLSIVDGRAVRTAFRNGTFDLVGLLSALGRRCARAKARRIVIDGLDVLLDMIDDPSVMRREVYRLSDWLSDQGLTSILTAKRQPDEEGLPSRYAFFPFLTDCVIVLQHRLVDHTASRRLRILKCRGIAHSSNEMPLVLSSSGLEVDAPRTTKMEHRVYAERVSTGVARLDTMLDGGYLRGTCILVSGAPGTSKTSLGGAFAEAACSRGEPTLFVSFEESGEAIARNLASVHIRLAPFVRSGLLNIFSVPASGTRPEAHMLRIASLLDGGIRCLVIDPISALIQTGANESIVDALLGLLDLTKTRGITVLLTASLLQGSAGTEENSAIGLSAIADTWLHLSYQAAGGERNRALTIVKSRGTGHSNQVRELILSNDGLSLVDVYTAGGAVLMGALRRQKEEEERSERRLAAGAEQARHHQVRAAILEAQNRISTLRIEVTERQAELQTLQERSRAGAARGAANLAGLRTLRGADAAPKKARPSPAAPSRRSRKK
jgi:circadian clock protein KaiC